MYCIYFSEERRRSGQNGTRPCGLRPKWPHAALLVTYLDQPNHTPRVLPGTIWAGNAAIWQMLTGPSKLLLYTIGRNNHVIIQGFCRIWAGPPGKASCDAT